MLRELRVLPAQAGMIPSESTSTRMSEGAPRASGDDPDDFSGSIVYFVCSPRKRG